MGACASKDTTTAAAVAADKPKANAAPAAQAATGEKPKPMIFAIMRNGHEVIRGGLADLKATVNSGNVADAKKQWDDLYKWQMIHAKMEEGSGTANSPIGLFK